MESDFDEKDLYMGLAAFHWSRISIKDSRVDQAFYQNIIEQNGGKALELGCGAGRLLLAYLKMGLDVEGVDISPDQLSTCRRDGEAAGLSPVLYEQKMQELNLPHCYNTIYIPCGGFECVMGRRVALEALKRAYAHLNPKGVLALNIGRGHANYYLDPAEHKVKSPPEWEPRADHQLEDGRRLIVYNRKIYEDLLNQYAKRERKYELYEGDKLIKEEIHIGQTHWYHRNEILWMLELVGFSDISVRGGFTDEELNQDHIAQMVFIATK
jgi:SAM-dependent methyltransferase